MAKGDVTLKFDAQTAQFVNDILKARAALDGVGSAARKLGDDASVGQQALGGIIKSLGMVTTVSAAAAMGVQLIMKSAEDYISRIEARAQAVRNQVETLASSMASAGQTAAFPAVNSAIKQMAGGDFSEAELSRAAGSVFAAEGFRATPAQITASLEQYKKARRGGMNEDAATDVAKQYARFAPSGLQDKSLAAHIAGVTEEDMRVFNRAGGTEEAFNMILSAHKNDEGARALAAIDAGAALAGENPKNLSTENRAKRRKLLAAMKAGGGTAYQTLLSHPELLGDEKTEQAARNLARGVADVAAHPLPTLDAQIASVQNDPELRLRQYEKTTAAKRDQAAENPESRLRQMQEDLRAAVIADQRREGGWKDFLPDALLGSRDAITQRKYEPKMYEEYNKAAKNPAAYFNDQHLKELKRIADGVNKIVGSNSTLSNSSEGQK